MRWFRSLMLAGVVLLGVGPFAGRALADDTSAPDEPQLGAQQVALQSPDPANDTRATDEPQLVANATTGEDPPSTTQFDSQ